MPDNDQLGGQHELSHAESAQRNSTASTLQENGHEQMRGEQEIDTTPVSRNLVQEKYDAAREELRTKFGNIEPLIIAKVIFRLKAECYGKYLHNQYCCQQIRKSPVVTIQWICFTALYPELACRLDELAKCKRELEACLKVENDEEAYLNVSQFVDWDLNMRKAFAISPMSPSWNEKRKSIQTHLENIEKLWANLQPEMKNVDVLFEPFVRIVAVRLCDATECLRRALVKVDWTEDTTQEALQFGIGMDPPYFRERTEYEELYCAPNPYSSQWYPEPSLSSPGLISHRKWVGLEIPTSVGLKWGKFQRVLGKERTIVILMGLFCTIGLAANIMSVYSCAAAERRPIVDSNFWSAFSQTNIGVAAIYSIIIPQLQGGGDAVPRGWRWLFRSLLLLSVLTALLSTVVYPWHGRTSIFAAFVSTVTQLAVTLQMVLGARRRINNLASEVAYLRRR